MLALKPEVVVPRRGAASSASEQEFLLMRDYLRSLPDELGAAVKNRNTCDEAYAKADRSGF
jgi:hypothetical protein